MDFPVRCFDCSLSSKDILFPIGKFQEHNALYHSEAPYGCKFCPVRFYDKDDKFTHEGGEHLTFPCLRCHRNDIKFEMERELFKQHYFDEHKDCEYPCSVCPNYFPTPHLVEEHFKLWHANLVTSSKRKCLNCDTHLERKDMASHNDACHKGLEYECSKCGNVFNSEGQMKTQKQDCKIWGYSLLSK